jgi:hypothetical protein
MNGVAGLVVGLLLCFFGVGSLHLAVLGSGFALGWVLAVLFGADLGVTVLAGLAGAVIAWVTVTLIFRLGAFFVGAVAGGVIGARTYEFLHTGKADVLLAVVFVLAAAGLCGLLANRYRAGFLMWACALGGAGVALTGLSRMAPDTVGFLRHPETGWETVLAIMAWLALALVGRTIQRGLFPRALHSRAQQP